MEGLVTFRGAPIQTDDKRWMCPRCKRFFYPVRAEEVTCWCDPKEIRDLLAAILAEER